MKSINLKIRCNTPNMFTVSSKSLYFYNDAYSKIKSNLHDYVEDATRRCLWYMITTEIEEQNAKNQQRSAL